MKVYLLGNNINHNATYVITCILMNITLLHNSQWILHYSVNQKLCDSISTTEIIYLNGNYIIMSIYC